MINHIIMTMQDAMDNLVLKFYSQCTFCYLLGFDTNYEIILELEAHIEF